jgi:hypothetical protein
MLDAKQEKLLLLAMDPGAQPGEAINAAVAFFRSIKSRYNAYEFLVALNIATAPNRKRTSASGPDYGLVTIPHGPYKGRQLRTIPVDDLARMVRERDDLTDVMRETIKRYMGDSDFRQ